MIDSASDESVAIVSDETWQASDKVVSGWETLAFNDKSWAAATVAGNLGDKPWTKLTEAKFNAAAGIKFVEPPATPAESLKIAKGFRAELLYSVPKDTQGSWVNLCVDAKRPANHVRPIWRSVSNHSRPPSGQ